MTFGPLGKPRVFPTMPKGDHQDHSEPTESAVETGPHFTTDPYCLKEGVTLVNSLWHNTGFLFPVIFTLQGFLKKRSLNYTLASNVKVLGVENFTSGTPYRAGEIAFDLGLWDLPVGTDTDVLSIQFAEWGPPLWVLEAVSDTTRTADLVHKKKVCEAMDILEYWIFDREATPKLQGWHWTQAGYREILADDTGEKPSAVLQTSLREIGDLIELRDPDLGNWVPMQKQAHAEGRVAGRAEAFAELLVVYVTRYSDSPFGREFRVWLQGHAITSWPDLGSLIQIVEDTNSSSQREQTFRLLLASPTDAPGRSTEK